MGFGRFSIEMDENAFQQFFSGLLAVLADDLYWHRPHIQQKFSRVYFHIGHFMPFAAPAAVLHEGGPPLSQSCVLETLPPASGEKRWNDTQ